MDTGQSKSSTVDDYKCASQSPGQKVTRQMEKKCPIYIKEPKELV
jgi:hypothetical protein